MKLVRLREQLNKVVMYHYGVTVVQTETLNTLVAIAEELMAQELCCRECYAAGKRPDNLLLRGLLND